MVRIFVDCGHGGADSGAVGNGLQEKDLTLTIGKKIEAMLKTYENVQVLMTREDDTFLSLTQRTNKANNWKADLFLSIHCNSAPTPSANGFESHIYIKNDARTVAYQNVLHEQVMIAIKPKGVNDRGKKQSDFAVVRQTTMPAILTENLFVSSPSDSSKLKTSTFLDTLAIGHVIGLEKFLGLKKSQQPPK